MDQISTKIALFKGKQIRKTIHNNEWWFVVADIIQILTETPNVKDYIRKMRDRDEEISKGWGQIVTPLSIETAGGVQQLNCATAEGIFRIIQSIPSPKAEPFKRWLAKVGYERVQEIEDPELGTKRTRALYKAKATFGVTPGEYKKLKGLKRENLRDHMDDFELIFTMLGERSTTEIHRTENSKGVPKLKHDAEIGGRIAGNARKELESHLGRSIVTKKNFKLLK
ncbi:MAG: Bro-N domain-containing protein [Candidatus Gracilibacteria bacterium]|jgi:hypothetical protein